MRDMGLSRAEHETCYTAQDFSALLVFTYHLCETTENTITLLRVQFFWHEQDHPRNDQMRG